MTLRACIVIPVYRHAVEAERLLERLASLDIQTFLVDDGNIGDAAIRLAALAERHAWVTLVRRPVNGGKGAAVVDGLAAADAAGFSHALQIDGDGQHDIAAIPEFLARAAAHPSALVAGAPRFDASAPLGRRIGRQISRVCVWLETLSFAIRDPMCGFRVYPVKTALLAARRTVGRRMDFDIEVLVRLHWAGVPFQALPTRVVYPDGGTSNFRLFDDNWRISWMHTRLLLGMVARAPVLLARRLGAGGTA